MSMIVNILENFLGTPSSHYEGKSQVAFDCPMCAQDKGLYDGDGRGNLAVNYKQGVYKCWSCWERNNMYGSLLWLIQKYGNEQHYKDYLLIAPKLIHDRHKKEIDEVIIKVKYPESYKEFSKSTPYHTQYGEASRYVKGRGLPDSILKRFKIGFTCDGRRRERIIIPSYDMNGELNYYIARSWNKWNKAKYMNPESDVEAKSKQDIIFNEGLINWDSTIYLVEGAFDHIVTPNSIPLLGKFISEVLFDTLQSRAKGDIVIVLDGGAEEKRDALLLYKRLNTLNLYNRIKIVYLLDKFDLSLIYEKSGPKGIITTLKTAHKLQESRL
jgi:hypothetical protein